MMGDNDRVSLLRLFHGGHALVIRLPNKPNGTKDVTTKTLRSGVRVREVWTWCPACYVRQVVEVLNNGEFRCTVCKHAWRRGGPQGG
jgi:hypothetical protein